MTVFWAAFCGGFLGSFIGTLGWPRFFVWLDRRHRV